MNTKRFASGALFVLISISLTACAQSAAEQGSVDLSAPSDGQDALVMATLDIPEPVAYITDPDSSTVASEKRAAGGDNLVRNLFERPFTAQDMLYQPDLDILHATIASDEDFYYFTLALKGVNESTQTLTGTYGIEFDRTMTGRGDLLVTVQNVGETWSPRGIQVYLDPNQDVGGPTPILADSDFDGDGYESTHELGDGELVYASLLPGYPQIIQVAVSRALLEDATAFLWGVWAEKEGNQPGAYDYNDRYDAVQAGSPLKDDENYPLAALSKMDNTCRQPFGFKPEGNIPGSCLVIPELETVTEKKPRTSFCCPNIGGCCSFPDTCGPDDEPPPPPPPDDQKQPTEPEDEPDPKQCVPGQPIALGDCEDMELQVKVICDGTDDILTLYSGGFGLTSLEALTPGFTCEVVNGDVICSGPKLEAKELISVEICTAILPEPVSNCKDFPNTFWVESLGICLPLGSTCCPIGEEWLPDEGRCIPIVTGDGTADEGSCGEGYQFIQGYCVYKGSLDACCRTVEVEAPCCYSSCAQGYVLNSDTLCCDVAPAAESCTWQCTNSTATSKTRCEIGGGKWVCR